MYTECPNCNSVFRVTAKVLQQARGRVRCGGCGNAFSALDFLSENLPESDVAAETVAGALGDAPPARDKLTDSRRQLLARLDELSGSDEVLIEDTGTEWRVLNALVADIEADRLAAADGEPENGIDEPVILPADAWRFDDDTLHPDAAEDDHDRGQAEPRRRAEEQFEHQAARPAGENQTDFILSEPGDWSDLLDEMQDSDMDAAPVQPDAGGADDLDARGGPISLEVEEELAAIHSALSLRESASRAAQARRFEVLPEPPVLDRLVARDRAASDLAILNEDSTAAAQLFADESGAIETIIMEGESVLHAIEQQQRSDDDALRAGHYPAPEPRPGNDHDDEGSFDPADTLFGSESSADALRGGRRRTDPPGYGVIVGATVFALLLAGQLIHTYRESLSTYGFFNQTIGPVYRLLGRPVTPVWDIQGWRFESTNGNVAGAGDVLTIVSRISNRADTALPYPLVHVSLSDRWEEIIGSRVLAPGEYLAGDVDPDRLVAPGEEFTAVITVEDPAVAATGFKLNVCYREGPGRVRCATEDFKD